jgi:hypothetical protein
MPEGEAEEPVTADAADSGPSDALASAAESADAAAPAAEAASDAADADGGEDEVPITVLWCSGDAPGSTTQHNFEGVWNLDEAEPVINGRPHYHHLTPDKTMVHLFFVENLFVPENEADGPNPGRAPRWMVGPTPGNGTNGWAYSDSDASGPEAVFEKWLAWMKDTSSWGEARLAFKERNANMGNEDDDEDEGPEGSPAGGGSGAPKKKKKKGAKSGAKKGAKKASGAPKKSARKAPPPKPAPG